MIRDFLKKFGIPSQVIKTRDNEHASITQIQNINFNLGSKEGQELVKLLESKYGELGKDGSNELYIVLIEKALNDIKESIKEANFDDAEKQINDLLTNAGFSLIGDVHKAEFIYYKGLIELENKNVQSARECVRQIFSINNQARKAYDLELQVLLQTKNRTEFELLEHKFIAVGIENTDLVLKKSLFEIACDNFETVISILTDNGDVKEEFIENADALYYLGICYLNTRQFGAAQAVLETSNQLDENYYKKYLLAISKILPIITEKMYSNFSTLKQHEILLNQSLLELYTLKEYISKKGIDLQVDYWGYVLTLKLFTSPNEILSDIEKLPSEVKSSDTITLMLAEAYYMLNEQTEALSIYEKLYEKLKNINILEKIIAILYDQENFGKLIEYIESIELSTIEEYSNVFSAYLMTFARTGESREEINRIIETYEEKFSHEALFYNGATRAIYRKDNEKGQYYLQKAIDIINKENEEELLLIALTCQDIKNYELALSILEDKVEDSIVIKLTYIEILIESQNEANLQKAEYILDSLGDEELNEKFLELKAEVKLIKDKYKDALEILTKLYSINPSENLAYRITISKINLRDMNDIDGYILKLANSSNPHFLMAAALALKDLKINVNEGLKYAYRALFLLRGQFHEEIYAQYISFFLPIFGLHNTVDESRAQLIENIKPDTVITLKSNNGEVIKYCLHDSQVEIEEGFLDCKHITVNSPTGISLLGRQVNSSLSLDGEQFTIIEIIDKYIYASHYCMNRYTDEDFDSKRVWKIEFDANNPMSIIDKLVPYLSNDLQREKYIFEHYEKGMLPIISIVKFDYTRYHQIIEYLLYKKNQIYISGLPNSENIKDDNRPLVVNLNSIILLRILNKLEVIDYFKERIYLPKSLMDLVSNLFELARKSENVVGTMYVDDGNRPNYKKVTNEEKQQEIEFWRDILISLKQCNVAEDIMAPISTPKGLQIEAECISLANQINGVLISDDICIKNYGHYLFESLETSNTISLFDNYYSTNKDKLNEYMDIITNLSEKKYFSCCSVNNLSMLVFDYLFEKPLIFGEGTPHQKFRALLNNILSDVSFIKVYINEIRNVIYRLYDKRINPKAISLLEILMYELKKYAKIHRLGNTVIDYILVPSDLDVNKSSFLTSIYNKC